MTELAKRITARNWTEEEDKHLTDNYAGAWSIPEIAKALGRSDTSVVKRAAIIIAAKSDKRAEAIKRSCIMHSLDLLRSGGRFT